MSEEPLIIRVKAKVDRRFQDDVGNGAPWLVCFYF